MKHSKHFFSWNISSFFSFFSFLLLLSYNHLSLTQAHTMMMPSQGMPSMSIPKVSASPMPSVHDMFKEVPQEELIAMMEEGQQFIKYLEEHGTEEEKKAFAMAMEDTLKNFTDEDWEEFNAIVETVQDKLPPLAIEPKEEKAAEPVVKTTKKEEPKVIAAVDNSFEKLLHSIAKAINSILLKAKSDKILAERITIGWNKKDQFNEMARLIQALNSKDLIVKITTSKDEAIVTLLESIQNFNKRLQVENNQFIIADTFGLQADEETTAANLKKINNIIDFFDAAIEILLPKLIKFLKEYEPEALKRAEENDLSAKSALEQATKIEKQKRPAQQMSHYDKPRSTQNQSPKSSGGYRGGNGQAMSSRQQAPEYLEQIHHDNLKNIPQLKKSSGQGSQDAKNKKESDEKDNKKSEYEKALDSLEGYLDANGNNEVGTYMTTVEKAGDVYKSFGNPIDEDTRSKFEQLQEKRSLATPLKTEESTFLKKYEERIEFADKNFAKNTQAAHSYYADLKDSIENISPQIDEMQSVMQAMKTNLEKMSSKDLEKLYNSTSLKNFNSRITSYHNKFKDVQRKLKNMHQLHKLERKNAYEINAYNELAAKVTSLHGLENKIIQAKSQLESLLKLIKSSIARRKRDENKAAHNN